MTIYTTYPALVEPIKRAGHLPVLVPPTPCAGGGCRDVRDQTKCPTAKQNRAAVCDHFEATIE